MVIKILNIIIVILKMFLYFSIFLYISIYHIFLYIIILYIIQ